LGVATVVLTITLPANYIHHRYQHELARLLNLQSSNAIYYAGQGIRGVYVFNTGSGYNAFEAACLTKL
jgi:hypothetical protein